MKLKSAIPFGWFQRAISCCRGRAWKACMLLLCALAAPPAALWWSVEWTDEGADAYPGGTVLRNAAGEVMRVSLGECDVDCRPYYVADPDDWIVKALVASEDGTFWRHCGVRPRMSSASGASPAPPRSRCRRYGSSIRTRRRSGGR